MYQIYLGTEAIGSAEVEKQGLMYCIRCRCRLSGEVAYKIIANNDCDLGLLVSENGEYVLTKRIPIKQLGTGDFDFRAVPRHVESDVVFVPVSADEPFKYLSRLQNAFMVRSQGIQGVAITDLRTE